MDHGAKGFYHPINEIPVENQSMPFFSDQDLVDTYINTPTFPEDPVLANTVPSSTVTSEEDPHEDFDCSDEVLRYINQILMEEDMDDKTLMLLEPMNLLAEEKSFYDVIGQKYPPSHEQNPLFFDQNCENPDEYTCCNSDYLVDPNWVMTPQITSFTDCSDLRYWKDISNGEYFHGVCQSVIKSENSMNFHGVSESVCQSENVRYTDGGSESVCQFEKGVEEANKFLPSSNPLLLKFEVNKKTPYEEDDWKTDVKVERKDEGENLPTGSKGRKFSHRDDEDLENERISKQAAIFPEPTLRSEMFDKVLLCSMGDGKIALQAYCKLLKNWTNKEPLRKGQSKGGPNSGKGHGKKQNAKKEVVDLRTLLMNCAQAAAADDHQYAQEILKQIRQHSSPYGDGNQRLAHCFADGLEARLAGTGSSIYKSVVSRRTIASDYLKAYHLYLASCPFRKISHLASNKTIIVKSMTSSRVHIIDFGILYGFQWPTFIQRIANRPGGPPRVRITGIEFPQTGFRPASGVEETGCRLADYAQTFGVPFEYNAIAKNWDSIELEDLKIEKDEYLVVNSLYRFKNLHDETVLKDSSRSIVLNLIKKVNPDLFIHGILNGSYGAPFFVTRFREALFHFSALFDMLETNVPREHHERMLIEREMFGKEAMNVIACEGWERVERPETYKQWQVRNLRAGFTQIPFSREVMTIAMERVTTMYHKDFLIDEDSRWLLLGWKGRTIYALSCWTPV